MSSLNCHRKNFVDPGVSCSTFPGFWNFIVSWILLEWEKGRSWDGYKKYVWHELKNELSEKSVTEKKQAWMENIPNLTKIEICIGCNFSTALTVR